jgi:hypothetical protein
VLTRDGEVAGGHGWRSLTAAAAGAVAPANRRFGLDNKREGKLQGVLGHARAARVGGASGRRVELAVSTDGGCNRGLVALQRA